MCGVGALTVWGGLMNKAPCFSGAVDNQPMPEFAMAWPDLCC